MDNKDLWEISQSSRQQTIDIVNETYIMLDIK